MILIEKYLLLDSEEWRPHKINVLMIGIKINANYLLNFEQALRYVGEAVAELEKS